ncbi:Acyl-ACP thioesterase, partial [Parasponia andersonii]
ATTSFRLHIPGNLYKAEKNNVALAVSDCYHSRNATCNLRRRCFLPRVSTKNRKDSDNINARKVNQTHEGDTLPAYLIGKFVDRFAYKQTFIIRSYETGPDKAVTMETIMNLLQETGLNHMRSSGLAGNRFGLTHEMSLRKLIWVVTRIHIQVQRYSCWGDIIEIDTWVDKEGKNGTRRDWIIRNYRTREIITRATM